MQKLENTFQNHADVDYAKWQENYMRNQFLFIGVRQPIRKKLQKSFISSITKKEISSLWNRREREFQYVAIDAMLKQTFEKDDLSLIEWLIENKSWWDSVDVLSSNIAGKFFRKFPDLISRTKQWNMSANIWLKRSSLLFQLRYKDTTDTSLLFEYCAYCLQDPSPWIQRAIVWALREYSKTETEKVVQFIQNNSLQQKRAFKILLTSCETTD